MLIVKNLFADSAVRAECIAGKEDFSGRLIGHHCFRPVYIWCFVELENFSAAEVKTISRFNRAEISLHLKKFFDHRKPF